MAHDDPHADETPDEAGEQREKHPSLIGRFFAKKESPSAAQPAAGTVRKEPEGVAHVPTAVLTVEYIDNGPAMDAALQELEKKLSHIEKLLNTVQETTRNLAAGFNRQNRDIIQMVEAVTRRLDNLYQRLGTAEGGRSAPLPPPIDTEVRTPEPGAEVAPIPERHLQDPEHKRAQRIAKVMASDLEAYNESKVKEGILYGNFHELLASQIKDARDTYNERVPERVRSEYDYFEAAIAELVQRKRAELLGGAQPQTGETPEPDAGTAQ